MIEKYVSGYSNSASVEYKQLSFKIERIFLSLIQQNVSNVVLVKVSSISSVNSGANIRVMVTIILIRRVEITSIAQRNLLYSNISSIVESGVLSPFNISPSQSFIYLKGKCCIFFCTFVLC